MVPSGEVDAATVAAVLHAAPSVLRSTRYDTTGLPPSLLGAPHVSAIVVLPGVAARDDGADGDVVVAIGSLMLNVDDSAPAPETYVTSGVIGDVTSDGSEVDDPVASGVDTVDTGGLVVVAAEATAGNVAGTTPASNAIPSSTPSPRRVGMGFWSTARV